MLQTLSDTVRSTLFAGRRRETENRIHDYAFPAGLRNKVAARLGLSNEKSVDRVLLGLKEYLILCIDARDMVLGMPSQAVDAAWHEFILYTRPYTDFCNRVYGHYLHHMPGDEPSTGDDFLSGAGRAWMDLGRTWMLTCMRADQNPRKPTRVPLLFSIDAEVGVGMGRAFTLEDLAALPIPPGFLQTEPGRYRYIAKKNRKARRSHIWWGPAGQGTSGGPYCGGVTGGHHGGHGGGCSGSCSSGGGCSGGGGGCGGGH